MTDSSVHGNEEAFILLGGNLGDRFRMLEMARHGLDQRAGTIDFCSGIYESEPWGFEADQHFLNQVVKLHTHLQPEPLMDTLRSLEQELGRNRAAADAGGNYNSRVIDLDILFFGRRILQLPHLIIPHPQLHKRRFTLEPLAEMAPGMIHPVFGKTISQLLDECEDAGKVHRLA